MAKAKFKRFLHDSDVNTTNIEDGSFIVTKDGTSYVDFDNERVAFGGTSDTQMSDVSINSVQNKVIKSYVDDVDDKVDSVTNDLATKFECGRILTNQMSSATIGGTSGRSYNLTFTNTYTTVPVVLVTVWSNNVGSYGSVTCQVANITTTGCRLLFLANVNASDIGLEYLVIRND